MENNETKVSVTLGYTLNLGNFQSLRVDLAVTDSARNEENVKQAMDRVYAYIESELVSKVKEAKESLEVE